MICQIETEDGDGCHYPATCRHKPTGKLCCNECAWALLDELRGVDPDDFERLSGMVRGGENTSQSEVPWTGCIVSYMITHGSSNRCPDLSRHSLMPKGWLLSSYKPVGTKARLEFTVDGAVKIEDGETVKQIMRDLGLY